MTRRTRKDGRGRANTFTPQLRADFLRAVEAGVPEEKAAADVGVSTRAIRYRAQHDEDFALALAQARYKAQAARMPHGATRYRKLGCRCDPCTADESAKRMARRDRQRARQQAEDEERGADVHHLPVRPIDPPPLVAGF